MRSVLFAAALLAAAPAAAQPTAPAEAPKRVVTFINEAPVPVRTMYVYPDGTMPWVEDVLADKEIAPGERFRLDVGGGEHCRFYFEAHFVTDWSKASGVVDACAPDPTVRLSSERDAG